MTDLFPAGSIATVEPLPNWPANNIKAVWLGEKLPSAETSDPASAVRYWRTNVEKHPIFDNNREHLVSLLVNTKMRCFAWNLISIGSLNEAIAHPREVFLPAIAASAYGFVLMHNHPSGDPSPSEADRRLTQRIKSGAELLQIRLVDHIVVGDPCGGPHSVPPGHFSFKECGLI